MKKQDKCALAYCSCAARLTDPYCSDDCKQAATHGTERDFCQCSHANCFAAEKAALWGGVGLPDSIQLAPGRVTIECDSLESFQEQVTLLSAALNRSKATLRAEIEAFISKKPPSSEANPTFARAEHA